MNILKAMESDPAYESVTDINEKRKMVSVKDWEKKELEKILSYVRKSVSENKEYYNEIDCKRLVWINDKLETRKEKD
jgi:hypothetical protein